MKEKTGNLEIAKDKALRSCEDLEKQLQLAKMQSSEEDSSKEAQVQQLADQVREGLAEKEKLQVDLDSFKSKIVTLEAELVKSGEEVNRSQEELNGIFLFFFSLLSPPFLLILKI